MKHPKLTRILAASALLALGACNQDPAGPDPDALGEKVQGPPKSDSAGCVPDPGKPGKGPKDTATIEIPNEKPVLEILSPLAGTYAPDTLRFQCLATDKEDGIVDSVIWWSSLTGFIGEGSDFRAALPDGDHAILVTAFDSKGRSTSDSTRLKIEGPLTLHTSGALDRTIYQYGDQAEFTFTVLNAGAPKAGVEILLKLQHSQTLDSISHSALTDGQGMARFHVDIEDDEYPTGPYVAKAQSRAQGYTGQEVELRFNVAEIDTTRIP